MFKEVKGVPYKDQPLGFKIYVNLLEYGRRFRHMFWFYAFDLFVILGGFGLLYLLFGCATSVIEPEDIVEPDDLVGIAESYCKTDLTLTCGKVYAFANSPVDNPIGMLELCVPWPDNPERPSLAQAEVDFGPAVLSPDTRFNGANLCWWQCPSMRGCNSYNGCYCPLPPEVPVDAGVDSTPDTNKLDFPIPDKVKEWLP